MTTLAVCQSPAVRPPIHSFLCTNGGIIGPQTRGFTLGQLVVFDPCVDTIPLILEALIDCSRMVVGGRRRLSEGSCRAQTHSHHEREGGDFDHVLSSPSVREGVTNS